MKNLYAQCGGICLILLISFSIPQVSRAQCTTCSGIGVMDSVVVSLAMDSLTTHSATNAITFPKFDPSVGTLTCIRMSYYVNTVLSFALTNQDSAINIYDFDYTQYSGFSGPGVFKSTNVLRNYGPYTLDTVGNPGDSVSVGPDTLFNNKYVTTNVTGSLASYLGTGNISINYDNSYSTHFLAASSNFDLQVRGYTLLQFNVAYYFCPTSSLASSILNFTALRSGNSIALNWTGENDQDNNTYEIEYSTDGTRFRPVAQLKAEISDTSNVSKYKYQYDLAASDAGRLYFRIKKTNAAGKSGYSPVRTVSIGGSALADIQVYPNPANRHLNLEWTSLVNGNLQVSVVNSVGQSVYDRQVAMGGASTLHLDLPASITPGIYYLRVRDLGSKTEQLTKLLIQ